MSLDLTKKINRVVVDGAEMAVVGVPYLQDKEVTPTKEIQTVRADEDYDGLNSTTVLPIPEDYIVPSGTLEITENETYDVKDYSEVVVNVASSGGGGADSSSKIKSLNIFCANYPYYSYYGTTAKYIDNTGNTELVLDENFDASNAISAMSMFQNNQTVTTISKLNIINAKNTTSMFTDCKNLTEIRQLSTDSSTSMTSMFSRCSKLITVPKLNTSLVTTFDYMFQNCTNLVTVMQLDLYSAIGSSSFNSMFVGCTNLTNLTLKNIRSTGLTIGSGTTYGHLLTVDSLVNTIKELWNHSSSTSTYKITMGTENTAKLADVYVKLITPTEEQIANDPYINNKMPCEVCASTDDGAMLITDYATLKKWTIA